MIKMVDEEFEYFYSDKGFGPAVDAQLVLPSNAALPLALVSPIAWITCRKSMQPNTCCCWRS